MRSVLDNLIGEVEDAEKPPPAPSCEHPEEKRKYEGGMGNVTGFKCEQCGAAVPVVKSAESIVNRAIGAPSKE
jgi:hypothetical protein